MLLVGVLVFVYYLFVPAPLFFNPAQQRIVAADEPDRRFYYLQGHYSSRRRARAAAARALADAPRGADSAQRAALRASDSVVTRLHGEALTVAEGMTGAPARDVNYVIPYFVLHELPVGFAGLFIAAVIAAAMSAVAGELASLSSATVIEFYRRWVRPEATDAHYLLGSRFATGGWGLVACVVAVFAASLGSLIEVVNRFGSFFYGSILGVFMLAMLPRARSNGAFVGLLAGMAAVAAVSFGAPSVSFLWHNVVGAVTVVAVGMAEPATRRPTGRGSA